MRTRVQSPPPFDHASHYFRNHLPLENRAPTKTRSPNNLRNISSPCRCPAQRSTETSALELSPRGRSQKWANKGSPEVASKSADSTSVTLRQFVFISRQPKALSARDVEHAIHKPHHFLSLIPIPDIRIQQQRLNRSAMRGVDPNAIRCSYLAKYRSHQHIGVFCKPLIGVTVPISRNFSYLVRVYRSSPLATKGPRPSSASSCRPYHPSSYCSARSSVACFSLRPVSGSMRTRSW